MSRPPAPSAPLAALALTLAACVAQADDAITGTEWHLIGIEGQRAPAPLSLLLDDQGKASGQAPCNRWFASNGAALPALALSDIGATKMACPDLAVEQAYFEALAAMERVELAGGHLFLIGPEGRVLEFTADPAADPADDTCQSCQS